MKKKNGKAGVFFNVVDETWNYMGLQPKPRRAPTRYTVIKDEPLQASVNICTLGYRFSVYGPNGYLCQIRGRCIPSIDDKINVSVEHQSDGSVHLKVDATGAWEDNFLKISSAYSPLVRADGTLSSFIMLPLPQSESSKSTTIEVQTANGWYDLTAEYTNERGNGVYENEFMRRYAGHVETGKPSITDPMLTYGKMV
jgi:phospholipase C